jgi:hypothetical protein
MCFSLPGVENFLLWLAGICFVIALLKLVVPWLLGMAGIAVDGIILRIINLVIGFIVVVAVIIVVFWLLECALGGAGFGRIR